MGLFSNPTSGTIVVSLDAKGKITQKNTCLLDRYYAPTRLNIVFVFGPKCSKDKVKRPQLCCAEHARKQRYMPRAAYSEEIRGEHPYLCSKLHVRVEYPDLHLSLQGIRSSKPDRIPSDIENRSYGQRDRQRTKHAHTGLATIIWQMAPVSVTAKIDILPEQCRQPYI